MNINVTPTNVYYILKSKLSSFGTGGTLGAGSLYDPHVDIHIHGCRSEVKLTTDKKMHLDLSV
jgi:hypothetical protein